MKNLKSLLLCLCLILSGIYSVKSQIKKAEIKTESTTTKKGFPNIFHPVENLFRRVFNIYPDPPYCPLPNVTSINLTRSEIILPCSAKSDSCSNEIQPIEISTTAVDPENDVLDYIYIVTGGKVIGTGAKVTWDLSGSKPGTYTITAAVDDGCGVCGTTVTKLVTVKECLNCN